jgi:hypothetical protein
VATTGAHEQALPRGGLDVPYADETSERLRRHFEATYLSLRLGIAAIGVALPVMLWIGALQLEGLPLQSSMSAYYYTGMRDVFVGASFAVGFALYVYRGFSSTENVVLSLAGVLAVCIALFPTHGSGERTIAHDVHTLAGILFFACLAYVSVFRAADTLSLIRDTRWARILLRIYQALGVMMLASPLVALVAERMLRPPGAEPSLVFFVQAFGVWTFAAYWLVKTLELRLTSADRAAAQGILEPSLSLERSRVPGRLVQTAPIDGNVDDLRRQIGLGDTRR